MKLEGVDHLWWPAERLLIKGVATLQELETWYSLTDILDRNDALDALEEAQAKANET